MRSLVIVSAVVLLVAAPAALAVQPPTILTAGIDARDQPYATWVVAAGTTFHHVSFATHPAPDPDVPAYFSFDNFATFSSAMSSPTGTATASYTGIFPVVRDRRYFAKVAAEVSGAGARTLLTSAVWVIDDAKPLIPGKAPVGSRAPTGSPASGRLLGEVPGIAVQSVPATFAALELKGGRVRVACPGVPCTAVATLKLGAARIGRSARSLPAGAAATVVVRPSAVGARRLRGRSRARLKLSARVTPAGAAPTAVAKVFTATRG